jgi:hypothetical protein
MRRIIIISLLALSGCLDGNERGGVITWDAFTSAATVNAQVKAHCEKYGKRPSVEPNAQPFRPLHVNQYQFDCVPR